MSTEEIERVIKKAKQVLDVIAPLSRWDQEVVLELANTLRGCYWVNHPKDDPLLGFVQPFQGAVSDSLPDSSSH